MYDSSDPAAAQRARAQSDANANAVRDAQSAVTAAWDKVEDIRRQAETLRDRWEDDGRICADRLREAGEKAPDKSFVESLGDMFDDLGAWFEDHLGDIGDIAGIVSAVAGVLAFVPVFTPFMAPLALATGALALAAHGADMVVNEKWDEPSAWEDILGDAIGLFPGAKAVGAGLDAARDAVSAADKVIDVGHAAAKAAERFGSTLTHEMGEMVKPGTMYQWVADHAMGGSGVVDDALSVNVAKALETSVTLTPQFPTAVGLFEKTDANEDMKTVTGYADTGLGLLAAFVEK